MEGKGVISSTMGDLMVQSIKPKPDWQAFASLCLGIAVGLFIGYQINVEKSAAIMAADYCSTCQENLGIMVGNFNVLAKTCEQALPFTSKNVSILPGVINQTVRVYA